MRFDITTPDELNAAERARWEQVRHRNPFLSFAFASAVSRFRPGVRIAVLSDGAETAGFLPYERSALGVGRPVGAGLTDCQGFIGPPGLEFDPRALLRTCRLSVWAFDHLLAEQAALTPYHRTRHRQPVSDLSEGYDAYAAQIRRSAPSLLRSHRRQERRLERDLGEVTHTFGERDPAELRRLMGWKSAQYRRTGPRDRFAQPWIRSLVEHLHESGVAVLSVVRAGGRPVALHLCLRAGTAMAGWFTAYDPALATYSPGMVGHLRLARAAADDGVAEIALGRGGLKYKDWLGNGEFAIAEGRVARASVTAGLHWMRDAPIRRARCAVLSNPRRYARAARVLKAWARLRPARGGA
jgi:CelD/BcsL family acetyltransferase involved in cellulose biosynthesis